MFKNFDVDTFKCSQPSVLLKLCSKYFEFIEFINDRNDWQQTNFKENDIMNKEAGKERAEVNMVSEEGITFVLENNSYYEKISNYSRSKIMTHLSAFTHQLKV